MTPEEEIEEFTWSGSVQELGKAFADAINDSRGARAARAAIAAEAPPVPACAFCGRLASTLYFRRPICGQCSEHLAGLRRKRQRRRKAGAAAK